MPDIEAKLRFLRSPQSYGDASNSLKCIETHMSWVFLVGQQVFKLKKPVRFSFLDFTSVRAREFYCREEVRLNARMAPGVYLGVVALQWRDGAFALIPEAQLPAAGETVDWLVKMRRLPRKRSLLSLIQSREVVREDLDALVDMLAAFYRHAPPVRLSADEYLARFKQEQGCDRDVLLHPRFTLRDAAPTLERLDQALDLCAGTLRERATRLRVLDGHGDLRPDHVFLLVPPVVIDCLEFSRPLREVDLWDEMAYLSLECAMAGAPGIGPHLISGLAGALDEQPLPALLHFYTAHRALLRARLAMAHLLDPQPRSPEKWQPLTERYLARSLAASDALIAAMRRDRPG